MHSAFFLVRVGCRYHWLLERRLVNRYPVHALALGVHSSAAVPRPSGSSLMPLRCAHQVPELRQCIVGGATVDRHHGHERRSGCGTTVYRQLWSREQVGGVLSAAA
jgi:hypothetical protein